MTEVTTRKHAVRFDPSGCRARFVLDRVADKWSLYVVAVLGDGELRFSEIKRAVEGISQRMLAVTLRSLERDGIVVRTVHAVMPPNIGYRLTPLGETLWTATIPLVDWATAHLTEVREAQSRFEQRAAREQEALVR
jgi:DNA-binding HxlR family transcriptional regulator